MPIPMAIKDIARKALALESDTRILSNRSMIDVMDARLLQLADRIDHEEAPERMKNLYQMFQTFKVARKHGRQAEMSRILAEMDDEFERIYHDYAAWQQMLDIANLRRQAVESEFKIVREMKALLTADQTKNLVGKLLAIIIREVKDPKALKRINYAFSKLIGEDRIATEEEMDAEVLDIDAEEDE